MYLGLVIFIRHSMVAKHVKNTHLQIHRKRKKYYKI